jgi:hypothetical protein
MVTDILAQIDAPGAEGNFTCGIVLRGNVVIEAAPIVKYMRRWSRARVRDYCRGRGWQVSVGTRSADRLSRDQPQYCCAQPPACRT